VSCDDQALIPKRKSASTVVAWIYGRYANLEYLCSEAGRIKSDQRYQSCKEHMKCTWIASEIADGVWDPRIYRIFQSAAAASGETKCRVLTNGFADVAGTEWECPDRNEVFCGEGG
jgi:hypothetical protein